MGLKSPMTDMPMSLSPTPPISRSTSHTSASGPGIGGGYDSPSLGGSSGSRDQLDVVPLPHVPSFESLHRYYQHSHDDNDDDTSSVASSLASTRRRQFGSRDSHESSRGSSDGSLITIDNIHKRRLDYAFKSSSSEQTLGQTPPSFSISPEAQRRVSEGVQHRERRKGLSLMTTHATTSSLPLMLEEKEDEVEEELWGEGREGETTDGQKVLSGTVKRRQIDNKTGVDQTEVVQYLGGLGEYRIGV